jgi:hypothetical protein
VTYVVKFGEEKYKSMWFKNLNDLVHVKQ